MSKTELKNGEIVQDALIRLCRETEFAYDGRPFVSVGQVAKDAGVSVPTARKYLNIMFEHDCAEWLTWNRMALYSWKGM